MKTVGIGIQDFEKIRKDDLFYVDKTLFIRDWYKKKDDVTLITRPRRFGKTLTLNMLHCFFSLSYQGREDLFHGLAIENDRSMMELQGSFPTISLSFASVKPETFRDLLMQLSDCIAELYDEYRFLIGSSVLSVDDVQLFSAINKKNQLPPPGNKEESAYLQFTGRLMNSLRWLSGWLTEYYGKKVVIFLDEYDTPLQSAYVAGFYEEAIPLMRTLFSHTFKTNKYLDRAVITGITRIAKESLFSDLNNLSLSSVMHGGYDTVFGFTGNEVEQILQEYEVADKKEELRFWYDGFSIGEETGIYNPWSVINYLAKKDSPPEAYWAQSGGVKLLDHLIRKGSGVLHENLQCVMQGVPIHAEVSEDLVFTDLDEDDNAVWSLLVASGYLKPVQSEERNTLFTLTNHEAEISFRQLGKRWFRRKTSDSMTRFAQAFLNDDLDEMNRQMEYIVQTAVSSFDSGSKPSTGAIHPENFFHGMTTGLLFCLMDTYHLLSKRESGFGRYDLSLIPIDRHKNPKAFILEFKVFDRQKGDRSIEDTAKRARVQIDDKLYALDLIEQGFSDKMIRKYGVGFRGKEVIIVS